MKKYKAILFDVDGTLLDTSEGIISSVEYAIKEMGLDDIPYEVKKTFVGPPAQKSFQRVYGLSDEKAMEAATLFRSQYGSVDFCKGKVYNGVVDLLQYLKDNGYKIGVATYKREDYAQKTIDAFNLTPYCEVVIGSDFAGKLTKADIIDICIENLKTPKDEILMIGDTEHDKTGAEKAGVDFLAVTYGFGFDKNYNEGLYASSCEEIINMLRG